MTGVTCRIDKRAVQERMERGLRRGAREALETLAAASRAMAPTASGRLRNSCRVDMAGNALRGFVAYGAPYAAIQHENLAMRHANGGEKYLENAVNDPAVRRDMLQAMADVCRAEWG